MTSSYTDVSSRKYDVTFFQKMESTLKTTDCLSQDSINIINEIANEVGRPSYIRTPNFQNKRNDVQQRRRNKHEKRKRAMQHLRDDDWEIVRNFQTTERKQKEGIDLHIDNIKRELNKMIKDNYDLVKDNIIEILENVLDEKVMDENTQNNIDVLSSTIFKTASSNRFYSEVYAHLYKDLMLKYQNDYFKSYLLVAVEKYIDEFNNLSSTNYSIADDDYDALCELNKRVEEKKSFTAFITNLYKNGAMSDNKFALIVNNIVSNIQKYCSQEDTLLCIEQLVDNLSILVAEIKDEMGGAKWGELSNFIEEMSESSKGDFATMSNKVIFKFMDMKELFD